MMRDMRRERGGRQPCLLLRVKGLPESTKDKLSPVRQKTQVLRGCWGKERPDREAGAQFLKQEATAELSSMTLHFLRKEKACTVTVKHKVLNHLEQQRSDSCFWQTNHRAPQNEGHGNPDRAFCLTK